ncbi:MAG: ABC transporter ATP-binding protein [Spirochaetia bacterium]|jgi:NitT/TauT family transport system ATP-binding protein|nr:ABC transporter ATP-binding protein [Spirochaetia bacterium]
MAYEIKNLSKSFGDVTVLDELSLSFPEGRISVVLGPSGCGKTSILNILAGLDLSYTGTVIGFEQGKTSYVFQEDRLLPWMSALDNVAFVLRQGMEYSKALSVAEQSLSAVGLSANAKARMGALSGGMRRRVALARAFAYPSDVLLLDEPFSALDLKTRIAVMDLFLDLRAADGRSAIVVTHDVREAIYLGNKIITLSEKPARTRDVFDLDLSKDDRAYASGAAAEIEARMYASILS